MKKTALLVLVIVSFTALMLYKRYLFKEQIQTALEFGQLASIPTSSEDVKVDTEGSMFSRTFWVTFKATNYDINSWILKSRSLKVNKRERLDNVKQFSQEQPEWFTPELIEQGETYKIDGPGSHYGTVWIDRKNKKVYIKTSYS